eukprot:CAMPEP_0119421108 /NCGR_PEP_ID=MMETSP1335-20130426/25140_1 /TAXON_ID=259385 /ORGANISM="Chrysoculter rhomboideus, Strain RCC1486" /LENGTH=50 /DNA_ID=CAMNT_0007446503 /DNA_START=44 /DNA_END=196 /DNA_ORIENTATION=-
MRVYHKSASSLSCKLLDGSPDTWPLPVVATAQRIGEDPCSHFDIGEDARF